MIIIGERINSSKPAVHEAIRTRNASFLVKEADAQIKAGADFIDINCALTTGDEVQEIDWTVSVIQSEFKDVNICVDSPNYLAIDRALKVYKGKGRLMINSVTGEEGRIKKLLPLALKYRAKLIALTMDESGMPDNAQKRFDTAKKILERVKKDGFNPEDLYFDPLVRPIATELEQSKEFLKAVSMIKGLGKVKTICGLSNISFGLPNRRLINSVFLSMAAQSGLDAAILDPLDTHLMAAITASRALLCEDAYCAGYIKAFREGKLK